jgi:hypothetical protein
MSHRVTDINARQALELLCAVADEAGFSPEKLD